MPMTIDGDGSITGLVAGGLPDNSITAAEIADGVITRAKVSTSQADSFAFCQAWVRFTGSTGVIPTNGSYNVSSVTRLAAGDYRVNFANALSSANYSVNTTTTQTSNGTNYLMINFVPSSTANCRLLMTPTGSGGGGNVDATSVSAAFFI